MRILIVSLYYPPLNTIAAMRVKGFVDNMTKEGIDVDVITRYYDDEQRIGGSMFLGGKKAENFDADYIREGNIIYTNFDENCPELRRFRALPRLVRGLYAYKKIDIYHFGWLKYLNRAFDSECSQKKYDFVISSYGPPIALLAGYRIATLKGINWVADFRDAYINEEDRNFLLLAKRITQARLLHKATALVFATDGMKQYFEKYAGKSLLKKPSIVVYNGVSSDDGGGNCDDRDLHVLEKFSLIKARYRWVLLHTGTVYPRQDVRFFLNCLFKFNEVSDQKIAFVFLGLTENGPLALPRNEHVFYLDKVSAKSSSFLQKNATALVLPVWRGRYTGFSGKTFDYLDSGTPVLCGPEPQKDLISFFYASGTVTIVNTYKDFETFMNCADNEFDGRKRESLQIFQRSFWVSRLVLFLRSLA